MTRKSTCPNCIGAGRCANCDGVGYRYVGTCGTAHREICTGCNGVGACQQCDGRGYVARPSE